MGSLASVNRQQLMSGENDFVQLYSRARLAGTPELYDAAPVREVQVEFLGKAAESRRYTL
jgi:hypothetical protein